MPSPTCRFLAIQSMRPWSTASCPASKRWPGQPVAQPSDDPYLRHLQEIQARYLGEIEREFYPLPILGRLVRQRDGRRRPTAQLGDSLFAEKDPGDIFYVGKTQEIIEDGEDFILRLPLPNVELDKVKLTKRGDELFVSIGNFKRELLLPAVLAHRPASGALFSEGVLSIRFPENGAGASDAAP